MQILRGLIESVSIRPAKDGLEIEIVGEIAKMIELAHSAGLKLNNERSLTAAADGVSKQLESITETYDGNTMAGLDSLIPGPDKYKGTARKPD